MYYKSFHSLSHIPTLVHNEISESSFLNCLSLHQKHSYFWLLLCCFNSLFRPILYKFTQFQRYLCIHISMYKSFVVHAITPQFYFVTVHSVALLWFTARFMAVLHFVNKNIVCLTSWTDYLYYIFVNLRILRISLR